MIYRLVTTWRDEENSESPILRAACDFPTAEAIEQHICQTVAVGIVRFGTRAEPMENGARLITTYVPIARIVGWFVWELPDDTSPWPIMEGFHIAEVTSL